MDLIQLIVVLIIVGVLVWVINTYVPMAAPFKTLVNVLIALVVVLWLLQSIGLLSGPIFLHRRSHVLHGSCTPGGCCPWDSLDCPPVDDGT